MSLKNKTVLTFLIITVYVSSCAHQTSPTGGPKDENPPVLKLSTPENKSLNYHGKTITLEFDEYVKLNNPKEEIIIIPRLVKNYEIKHKKNKIIIEIKDSLQYNTTYTFNFREGIQDLNESNSPENLQLTFSTGDYLDSLSISGNVFYLLSNKPEKGITLSLYDATDTLNLLNSPPVYFTKTDSSGHFIFNNLKHRKYNIFAIGDQNKNLTLESKNEFYSYLDRSIELDSNISKLKLPLIKLDITPLELQYSRTRGHYFVLKYNKYVSSYTQHPVFLDDKIPASSFSKNHREIKYYNQGTITDSLSLIITAYDTINNPKTDTVHVMFEETKRTKDDFKLTYSSISIDKTKPVVNTELSFSKPVLTIDFDSIYFQIDSATHISFDSADFKWNSQNTLLTIKKAFDKTLIIKPNREVIRQDSVKTPKSKPQKITSIKDQDKPSLTKKTSRKNNDTRLYFGSAAFLSIEQDSSILHIEKVAFIDPSKSGSILVHIETISRSYFTQLINTNGEIVSENYNGKKFSFDNTPPGKYTIRVLVDQNENKLWEIGNISKNILPEPVIFYVSEEGTSEITVRENWILGPHIIKF